MANGYTYLIFAENLSHCFTCQNRILAEVLVVVAGLATWLEFHPQRVWRVEFREPITTDPVTAAVAYVQWRAQQ